ncbi:MAG: hypothetical protein WKF29_05070 [Thermoleophilaceae bacterium]
MEFFVILFFFGLSAGAIGKIKGSSFFLWFLIGFCLPFLGTLAALVSRGEREVVLRRCPDCTNVVPIHDQICNRCGADLDFPVELDHEHAEPEPVHRQERLFEA